MDRKLPLYAAVQKMHITLILLESFIHEIAFKIGEST